MVFPALQLKLAFLDTKLRQQKNISMDPAKQAVIATVSWFFRPTCNNSLAVAQIVSSLDEEESRWPWRAQGAAPGGRRWQAECLASQLLYHADSSVGET